MAGAARPLGVVAGGPLGRPGAGCAGRPAGGAAALRMTGSGGPGSGRHRDKRIPSAKALAAAAAAARMEHAVAAVTQLDVHQLVHPQPLTGTLGCLEGGGSGAGGQAVSGQQWAAAERTWGAAGQEGGEGGQVALLTVRQPLQPRIAPSSPGRCRQLHERLCGAGSTVGFRLMRGVHPGGGGGGGGGSGGTAGGGGCPAGIGQRSSGDCHGAGGRSGAQGPGAGMQALQYSSSPCAAGRQHVGHGLHGASVKPGQGGLHGREWGSPTVARSAAMLKHEGVAS
ncbi:hypothetical protein V8C86DRAFT_2527020, partial [Haematococcus lacustris]